MAGQHHRSLLRPDPLVAHVPRGALMRRRTSRRLTWAVLVLLLFALVVPPLVNVNRYRARVTGAIGRALGRSVTFSKIQLKLLPRPGLVLYNFVVSDAPGYSAEPMLRADT